MAKYIFLCGRAPKKPQPFCGENVFCKKERGCAKAQPLHIQFVFWPAGTRNTCERSAAENGTAPLRHLLPAAGKAVFYTKLIQNSAHDMVNGIGKAVGLLIK